MGCGAYFPLMIGRTITVTNAVVITKTVINLVVSKKS